MRKKIIAGNWKMNLDFWKAQSLINNILNYTENNDLNEVEVIIAPSSLFLHYSFLETKDTKINVSAQNMHQEKNGAYTGEISADMLISAGIKNVILGHSERRQYFGETNELLKQKVKYALAKGINVIFCNGETLEERQSENHFKVIEEQTKTALFDLSIEDLKHVVIAYEPVWAIGTGETASPEQAQEMHAYIRSLIADKFGKKAADGISILYGGSVKPSNADSIFAQPDVDGGLIGGAALKAEDFIELIKARA